MLNGHPERVVGKPPLRMAPVLIAALAALAVVLFVNGRIRGDNDRPPAPTVVSSSADSVAAASSTGQTHPASSGPTTTGTPSSTGTPSARSLPGEASPSAATPAASTVPDDGWVQVNDHMRTRCAPHGSTRLFLATGETEPVGLLDDTCPA